MLSHESTVLFDSPAAALRENTLLDTKQETLVRATISSTQYLIAGLDAKIRHIENALADLHNQRDAALETMAIHVALLAPVRRLPPEILGEIFQQCVPIKPTHVTPFDSRDAPLLLTRICHRWRQVAQGTPSLWNKLVLYGRTPESFFSSIWLNNSGSFPLDIAVERNPHGLYSGRRRSRPVGDRIDPEYPGHGWRMDRYMVWLWPRGVLDQNSQMVVEQLSRIRRLSLVCEAHELRGYFPKEPVATLPCLQELSVQSMDTRDVDRTDYTTHNISTPQLQTLLLHGGAEFLLPALKCTSNLRNLDIRGDCALQLFVDFVSMCPALQRIDAFDMHVKYPRDPMDTSHIVLSSLSHLGLGVISVVGQFGEEFDLDSEDWSHRMKSLERLRTPNLQSMEIRWLPYCGRILSNSLADSQSQLRTLTRRGTQLVATSLGDATSIFTSIEKIEFVNCDSEAGFWGSLVPAEDKPSHVWTFPKLKGLLLEAVYIAPEHEAEFVQFVERRAPPLRSQGQPSLEEMPVCYLEEIELTRCCFSTETLSALERLKEDRDDFSIMMKGESSVNDEVLAS